MGCGFCGAALPNIFATLVVDCVVKPLVRQFDYVRHFHDNVEKLREKKHELADARARLLHKIEDAKSQLLQIENDVQNLQSKADETTSDMGTLEQEIQLNKRCLNWCPNCKSSKAAFDQIIEALKDENIDMIGLWGMGGAGKTTLAREVRSQAPKLNLFDKVVIMTPNLERIQDQITQYIGFDMKNERGKRSEQELWLRLKNEPRILIILDDIWKSIKLKKKIGIPIGDDHKGYKVLLTTRRQQIVKNVVQLDCLGDDEAWTLFKKKAGLNDFSDDSIKILANQIVKKCRGLPTVIVLLGSALKGKTHHEWQVTNRRLKDLRLTEIEDGNEENAYVCLEASFDYLKNMETKRCFLLCSLFPEDDEIYVENLVGYAWGLELYKGMDSIKDVRTISFETDLTDEIPKGVGFPYLKLLLIGSFMKISSEFFEGVKALQVCALEDQLISLDAFKFNMNIRTLCLIDCELSDISMLGKLKTLHILSLSRSDITKLPTEAGDLENLRLFSNLEELYLHGCSSLKWATENTTQKESYSSLLSWIYCQNGFVFRRLWSFDFCIGIEREMWYQKGETYPISRSLRINNSIDACKQLFEDVESLQLNDVEGHPNLIPSLDMRFSKLTSLDLDWCDSMQCLIDASEQQVPITVFSNLRKLSLSNMFDLEEMCNVPQPQGFLQKLEEVIVSDYDKMQVLFPIAELRSIKQEAPQPLKIVEIERCNNLKYIFPAANSLGQLHALKIKSCRSLEGIIQDSQVPYITLQSLREIKVEKCNNLKCLFPLSVANSLGQLHTLKIKSCRSLEGIIQHSQVPYISLQSLREIEVEKCNNLKYLFLLFVANSLGQLHTLKIKSCWSLEGIIQDSQVPYISLQSLREIEVEKCDNLKYLFPLSIANTLAQLHTLKINSCSQLEDIIQDPQVSLIDLPQLKGRDLIDIILTQSSLQKLTVYNCSQLTHFIISTKIQVRFFFLFYIIYLYICFSFFF
ncbi:hypothetical protein CXB51_009941 [Gossypium anomalum]|uniref:NB-ARC domain-containing protein n=1 Tax=Gossypium anomalum TaxID=47600 RepID=A0A8J6D277_9ROSI|nr:hypothetical protein CXB51_009941 [Gossypium anomalum]